MSRRLRGDLTYWDRGMASIIGMVAILILSMIDGGALAQPVSQAQDGFSQAQVAAGRMDLSLRAEISRAPGMVVPHKNFAPTSAVRCHQGRVVH